ncbi:tyrosine-type recombinase/integrase [Agrobacterium leguminum]|nr:MULTISPECIES: tyrosine-type recombinase/integrase [Agrobacterium]WFS67880.1 tyrosine-type recombinase/integrase [Agrobacterium leguminum]
MKKASGNISPSKRKLDLTNIERGLHHLVVKQMVRTESGPRRLPKLYILTPDGNGGVRPEPFEPILEYFEDRSAMSFQWKKNASRAMGLLIDYAMAMSNTERFHEWEVQGKLQRRLFRGLAVALVHGTAALDSSGRLQDGTNLHWKPLGRRQAGVLLSSLTLFFRWLREDDSNSRWAAAGSTEEIGKHPSVALRLAIELQIRWQSSLLGHLKGVPRHPSHPYPFVSGKPPHSEDAVPTFPSTHVMPFLRHGFMDPRGDRNYEAELVAHLTFGLGLRESEPFHLYVTDVQFVQNVPWVFFHHPAEGKVMDGRGGLITRREYLRQFGLLPRNEDEGARNEAGWKGMSGDGVGTPGFWLPIDPIRNRSAELLKRYIFVTRPAIMAARPRSAGDHPFLLVNPRKIEGWGTGEMGDPYTIEAFEGAWETAVEGFGRRVQDPNMAHMRKHNGNTPHGARHFYGRFLYSAGVDGTVIQRCMHHRTLDAHKAYTRLTPSEINDILRRARHGERPDPPFHDLRNEFMSQFENIPPAV